MAGAGIMLRLRLAAIQSEPETMSVTISTPKATATTLWEFRGSNGTLRVEHTGRETRTDGADRKQARYGLLGCCCLRKIS
jgi:hypothetical protein